MREYIFLDTWVLSDYTKENKQQLLSNFVHKNGLTIMIDSLSLTELYNPDWRTYPQQDRAVRVAKFLGNHATVIVDPTKVFKAEIQRYPQSLTNIPIELNFENVPQRHRARSLLMFLRGDTVVVEQGKDIRIWAKSYQLLKSTWLNDVVAIIDNACQSGTLSRNEKGHYQHLESSKEEFLSSLDRRHFAHLTVEEREKLGPNIIELCMGGTSKLPAVRFSSLCFWYAYIQSDKSHPMAKKPSDIGDFYQMSLIPYCSIFCTDNTMHWLAQRIKPEIGYTCEVVNKKGLDKIIGS